MKYAFSEMPAMYNNPAWMVGGRVFVWHLYCPDYASRMALMRDSFAFHLQCEIGAALTLQP